MNVGKLLDRLGRWAPHLEKENTTFLTGVLNSALCLRGTFGIGSCCYLRIRSGGHLASTDSTGKVTEAAEVRVKDKGNGISSRPNVFSELHFCHVISTQNRN